MPILKTPDWTWKEVIKCKWYCNQEGQEKRFCWPWCRNFKHLWDEEQEKIKKIEVNLYNTKILSKRKYYLEQIESIIEPNTYNWKKLKEIEKYI